MPFETDGAISKELVLSNYHITAVKAAETFSMEFLEKVDELSVGMGFDRPFVNHSILNPTKPAEWRVIIRNLYTKGPSHLDFFVGLGTVEFTVQTHSAERGPFGLVEGTIRKSRRLHLSSLVTSPYKNKTTFLRMMTRLTGIPASTPRARFMEAVCAKWAT